MRSKIGYKEASWAHTELPKTTGKLQWTHCKKYQHVKENRNYQPGPRGNEEYNFWTENTVEGLKSRLNEAEYQISELEDKVEKNSQNEQEGKKSLRKDEQVVREMQDNMKRNNIHIIGIPEGEEEQQGIENLFEKVMMENFPNLMRE